MPFLNKYPGDNFLRNIGVVNGPSKTIGLAKILAEFHESHSLIFFGGYVLETQFSFVCFNK